MDKASPEAYRKKLVALLKRLGEDREDLKSEALQGTGGETSGSFSDVPTHMGDLGTHYFEEEMTLNLIENEEKIIEEVNAALERIEQGTFGRCEGCRQTIASERLEAVPYTRYCIVCARKRLAKSP
jgi:RNA polymerase-binding transcription factor DksA